MINKNFYLRLTLGFVVGYVPMSSLATTLKIVNLAPNKTIRIDSRDCYIGDTIDSKDTIHWDSNLDNQFIKVICLQECNGYKSPRQLSKHQIARKSSIIDLSFYDINGMFSKGDNNTDPILLWPGKLILIEGVVIESGFNYSCRIRGNSKVFNVEQRDEFLYLKSDDFKDFGTELTLEIYKTNAVEKWDIQVVKVIEVEQAK